MKGVHEFLICILVICAVILGQRSCARKIDASVEKAESSAAKCRSFCEPRVSRMNGRKCICTADIEAYEDVE